MCENSEVRFACRNFRFDLSNVKINPAGDHSRETAIEKTILRVPRARAFLHRLGHFRPIDGVFAMSAVHSISTELLHYGKAFRTTAELESRRYHCPNSRRSF
jgi:hypothetical protein